MVSCAKGTVRTGVELVVEDMHRSIANLQKFDMACDGLVGRRVVQQKLDAVLALKRGDAGTGKPDRHLDRDRYGVIGEHEPLELLVAPMIVPDAGSPGERTGICTTLPLP
ncbi:MAG: hypothetical protein WB509_26060 [Acetobacteraceae bacterium]